MRRKTYTHTPLPWWEKFPPKEKMSPKKEDEIISSHVWIGGTVTFSMKKKFLVSLSAAVNQLWRCYTSPEKCSLWLLRVKHAEEHGKFPLSAIRMSSVFLVCGAHTGHVDWVFNRSPVHDVLNGVWRAVCNGSLPFFTRLVKNRNDTIQVKWKIQPGNLSEFLFPYVRPGPLKCFFLSYFWLMEKDGFLFPLKLKFFIRFDSPTLIIGICRIKERKKIRWTCFPFFGGSLTRPFFLLWVDSHSRIVCIAWLGTMSKRPQGDWSHWLARLHSMRSVHTYTDDPTPLLFGCRLWWPPRYSHSKKKEETCHVFFLSLSPPSFLFLFFFLVSSSRKSPKSDWVQAKK